MITDAPVTVLPATARAVSGTGPAVDLGAAIDTLRVVLDVAATAGTGATLAVTIETSADGALWRPARSFAAANTRRRDEVVVQPVDRYARAVWTITGSPPSFYFGIAGVTRRAYATIADLRAMGLAGNVLAATPEEVAEAALYAASCEADGMLSMRYARPITAWGADLRLAVCKLAAWGILSARGFNPDAPADAAVRKNRDDAMAWLAGIAKNEWAATGIVDATPDEDGGDMAVVTEASRRW